jgi:hypothetical protein
MHLMLRRHLLWHLLSTIIFNFLILNFYSIFSILQRLQQFAYYLTIRLDGSVVTSSDLLDIFVFTSNHLKMASCEGRNM